MLTTILVFAGILLVLVLVHEFGHFFAARKTGMVVEEFGFGFPPKIASIKRGGTKYSFNALPLGGFVKIQGENGDDERPGSFSSKSIPKRLSVLAAGVLMNFVLAWVLLSAVLMMGAPQVVGADSNGQTDNSRVVIGDVLPDSPASSAGIEPGDVVYKIDGEEVKGVQTVQDLTRAKAGSETVYEIKRNGDNLTFKLTPRVDPPAGQGAVGVALLEVADVSYPWYQAIWKGLVLTWDYTVATLTAFGRIIGQLVTPAPVTADLAGPIGIAVMTGQFVKMGIAALLQFAAVLSINLAIINALPIPALDGGRMAFVGIEAIRGRRVRAKVEQWSHAVGFALLLALMILVTVRDIVGLFS